MDEDIVNTVTVENIGKEGRTLTFAMLRDTRKKLYETPRFVGKEDYGKFFMCNGPRGRITGNQTINFEWNAEPVWKTLTMRDILLIGVRKWIMIFKKLLGL